MTARSAVSHGVVPYAETPEGIVRILVVDDNHEALVICKSALSTELGFKVRVEESPLVARKIAHEWRPDVIILDVAMPDMDGFDLARVLIADGCDAALMFVTSKTSVSTKVEGLKFADQFLTKPYNSAELLAQVRVLLRNRERMSMRNTPHHDPESLWPVFDAATDKVHIPRGRDATLTPTERKVLLALLAGEGEPVTKEKLLSDVWDSNESDPTVVTVVEVYVRRLRKKIEIDPARPERIITAPHSYYYNLRP